MKKSTVNEYLKMLDKRGNEFLTENATYYYEISDCRGILTKLDLAAAIAYHRCEISKQILIKLCGDKNYLVRAESVESLAALDMPGTYETVKRLAVYDNSYIVRGYAQYGLSGMKLKKSLRSDACCTLSELLPRERFWHNKACVAGSLYRFGFYDNLDILFSAYRKTERYQTKCCVLGILEDILNEENKDKIREFVITEFDKDNVPATEGHLKTLSEMVNR